MSKLIINADFYRIAAGFMSTEETRYYLRGVFVEPASVGALLIATDGHRLMCIHDEKAVFPPGADRPIIALSPEALKACRSKRSESNGRLIELEDGSARVIVADHDGIPAETVAVTDRAVIDGTFPDWRRVLPQAGDAAKAESVPAFNGKYLGDFGRAGAELFALAAGPGYKVSNGRAMQVLAHDNNSPAWVRWSDVPEAFGVLMPVMRAFDDAAISHPDWVKPQADLKAVA